LRHNPTRREGQHKTLATTHSELVLEAIEAQPNKEGRSTQNISHYSFWISLRGY
jgi:hypothetical protein